MDPLDKRRRKRLREIAFDFNNRVSPGDLLDKLPCISLKSDTQRIRRYARNEGDTTANRELCSCLVGKTGWYDQLIEGLKEIGPVEILEKMKSDAGGSLLSPIPVVRSTVGQTPHRISENQPAPPNRRSISEDTPVVDLPAGVRAALSFLDHDGAGISHNWEDLANCFGMTWEERNCLETVDNPSARVVEMWYQKNPSQANLGNLISRLCSIERLDVVSKIKEVVRWRRNTQEDGAGSNRQLGSQQDQENFIQSIEKHHHYENNLKGDQRQELDLKDQSDALQKQNSSTRTSPGTHFNSDGMKTVYKQPMPVQGHPPQQSHRPPDNRMKDPSRDLMKEPQRATSREGHARKEEKNQQRSMGNYETKASYPSVNMPGMETSLNNSTAKPHSTCEYGSEPQQNNRSLVQQEEPTAAPKLGMASNIGHSPRQANRNHTEHDAGTVKFDKSENTPQGPQSVSSPPSPVAPKSQPLRGQKSTTSSSETGAENVSPGRTPSAAPKRLNAEAADNTRRRPPSGNLPVSRVTPPSSPVKELKHNIRSSETCTDNVSPPRLTPKSTPEKGSDVSTKKENYVQLGNSNNGFSDTNDLGNGRESSKITVEGDISSSSPKSLASTDVFLCKSEEILVSEASSSDSSELEASQPQSTSANPRGQTSTTSSSETGAENVSPGRTTSATPKRLNAEAADNTRRRPPSGNLPVSRVTPPSSPVKELKHNIRSSETCTDNVSPPRLTPKSTPEKGSDVSTKKENYVQLGNSNNGFSDTNDLGSGRESSKITVEGDISSSSPKSLASTDVFLCKSEEILLSEASSSDSSELEASQPQSTTANPRNEATSMTGIPENQTRDVRYVRGKKEHAENISQSETTDHNKQQTTTISVEEDEKANSLVKNSRDDKMVETPGVGLRGEHFVRGREEEKVTSGISEMQTKDKLKSEEPDDISSCSARDIKRGGDITTMNQVGHLDNYASNTPSHEEGDFKIHPLTSQEAGPRKETDYGPNIDGSNKTVMERNKRKGIPQTTADSGAEVLQKNDNNANETKELVGGVESEPQQATSSDCGPQRLRSRDASGVLLPIMSDSIFKMGFSALDMSIGNGLANQEAGPRKETDYGPNIDGSNKTVMERNKSKGIPQTTADSGAEVLQTNDNNANETQDMVGRVESEPQQATSSDCGPQRLRSRDASGVLLPIMSDSIFKMGFSALDMSIGNGLANQEAGPRKETDYGPNIDGSNKTVMERNKSKGIPQTTADSGAEVLQTNDNNANEAQDAVGRVESEPQQATSSDCGPQPLRSHDASGIWLPMSDVIIKVGFSALDMFIGNGLANQWI